MTRSNVIHFIALMSTLGSLAAAQPMEDSAASPVPNIATTVDSASNAAIVDTLGANPEPERYRSEPEPSAPNPEIGPGPFSLFDYREIVSVGVSLSWLYYAEDPDIVNSLPLLGVPKSTEYGSVIALSAGGTYYNWRNRLVVRPRLSLLIGYDDTYDGSSQGDPVLDFKGDTEAYVFTPIKFQKTNIFLSAECNAGYAFLNPSWPLFVYSGLNFNLWFRDLLASENVLISSEGYNYETYYWFSVPLGVNMSRSLNPRWIIGADASVNFMIYGGMQVGQASGGTPDNYPAVTLGNRTSAKVEFFVEKKRDNKHALRFAPYFLYYTFGRSNTATATDGTVFYEPTSNSFLFGATLTWEFLGKHAN